MALNADELAEISRLARREPQPHGAAIEALRAVQRRRGWISDETLGEVAQVLGMTADELDSVATFYNLIFRRPVGRHVVLVCDSVSCWIMGCDELRGGLETRLGIAPGQTTPDGRFTLLPIVCLGACDHAPALMIDGDLHGDLDPAKLDHLLEDYR